MQDGSLAGCTAAEVEGAQEFCGAVPEDLDTDTEEEKGGQPHHDGRAGGADELGELGGVAVEAVHQHDEQQHGGEGFEEKLE